jgi:hypothetical protein
VLTTEVPPSSIRPRRARRAALRAGSAAGLTAASLLLITTTSAGAAPAFPTGPLTGLSDTTIANLVAPNGDENPFGIAVIPETSGLLTQGNLLVAEYSDLYGGGDGDGTTLLQVNPVTGATSVFFQGSSIAGPVGIALGPTDSVWVGDYGLNPDGSGSNIAVISPAGVLGATYTSANVGGATNIDGVWGQGVSTVGGKTAFYWGNAGNASSGTGGGDVWRVNPGAASGNGQPLSSTYDEIASGQGETPAGGDSSTAAGPQGFAFDAATGTLYETNDADNTLYAIPNAATATSPGAQVVYQGAALDSPENVVMDPATGDLLVVNAGNNTLTDISPAGSVLGVLPLTTGDPNGSPFGLAVSTNAAGQEVLYYTDDNTNTLHELVLSAPPAETPEAPLAAGLPLAGLAVAGGALFLNRRRAHR